MIARLGLLAAALLQIGLMNAPPKPKQYIAYASEQATLPAGKKATVELHFKVVEGYHVNSHTPKSDLLIPTTLTLQPAEGVKPGSIDYPRGTEYSFTFQPGEKLDVYSGAFTIKLPIEATPGDHTLTGNLHYQACDQAACYPPKNLPISVVMVAR